MIGVDYLVLTIDIIMFMRKSTIKFFSEQQKKKRFFVANGNRADRFTGLLKETNKQTGLMVAMSAFENTGLSDNTKSSFYKWL